MEISCSGRHLLIDPYLTRFGLLHQWIGRVEPNEELIKGHVGNCDILLVTHSHWDHLLDVPYILKHTGAQAFGSKNTAQLLGMHGISKDRIRIVRHKECFKLHGFQVKVFKAHHMRAPGFGPGKVNQNLQPPLRARDYRMDLFFCFHIEVGGISLITEPGDIPSGMAEAQILLVSPKYKKDILAQVLNRIRPKTIIPYHWDNMYRPLERPLKPMLKPPTLSLWPFRRMDLEEFQSTVAEIDPKARVFMPEVLRHYKLHELLKASAYGKKSAS